MVMNRDLFLAILSMDSYNRGYEQGIMLNPSDSKTQQNESGRKIGAATILRDANDKDGLAKGAGFYGLAYDVSGAGIAGLSGTVIAYRGTDGEKVRDIVNGWPTGGGIYNSDQARLAVEFYKRIVGVDAVSGLFTANPFTSDITLTGHSLGGGLAGYIAALYGKKAEIFDNMPFESAADQANEAAFQDEISGLNYMRKFLYGQYNTPPVKGEGIKGYEPPRLSRRHFQLSHATISRVSTAA